MVELEHAQTRLDNIRSVQPILSALHAIALGSWQAALNQSSRVRRYEERLSALLPPLLPHLPAASTVGGGKRGRVVTLVVGSERGLCGRFNATAVDRAEAHLAEQAAGDAQVELMALGTRVHRLLQRRGYEPAWWGTLSITTLPPLGLALDLTRRWLARYEARELDAVDLVYNAYHGMGDYQPAVTRLIPPQLPADRTGDAHGSSFPIIVETDPLSLYARIIEQWTAVRLYGLLLESATAEHAARYGLTEAATQNADELIAELTLAIQTARQRAITREMQELAVGAGMVGTDGKDRRKN